MLSKPQDLDEDSERMILSISGGCGESKNIEAEGRIMYFRKELH